MNGNHEEADTRIVFHVYDSLERGANKIMVRTVDTDIVVILIDHFYNIVNRYPEADIWVAFGIGKWFGYYCINSVCANLGRDRSYCLPLFHTFTRCDTTSSFFGRTKKTAWATWNAYPEVTEAFLYISNNPYGQALFTSSHILLLERFTVLLYDKSSVLESVNQECLDLFSKKNKTLEHLPPTKVENNTIYDDFIIINLLVQDALL